MLHLVQFGLTNQTFGNMVKVRTSQIPEDSPIRKVTLKKQFHDDERDELDDLLNSFESNEDEKKTYYKTFITFPELGYSINPSYIQTIEKNFRLKESSTNFEAEPVFEYGIVINRGITTGLNSPKGDIEFWFRNEYVRDKRYNDMMKKFDEIGVKVITI